MGRPVRQKENPMRPALPVFCLFLALNLSACDDPSGNSHPDASQNNQTNNLNHTNNTINNTNNTNNSNNLNNTNNQPGICHAADGQLFHADFPWNQRVDEMPPDAESDAIIAYLQDHHASTWAQFMIDGPSDEPGNTYGFAVLDAAGAGARPFTPTEDHFLPDCDLAPLPVPAAGALEGEEGYACTQDGDCHLLVVDRENCRLYEMWRANIEGDNFWGGCLAVWDLEANYSPALRGDCCTSADAAGLPITPLLFGPDDIAAGEIRHALRFILPNANIRNRIYVRPATHSTGATSGPADAPPYGARLRLRADFDMQRLSEPARVVARALQEYGMILADGGNITFTARNERFDAHTWAGVGLGPRDLRDLQWTDFEVVELGTRYTWDDACSCDRTPLTR